MNRKEADEIYLEQYQALRAAGIGVSLFSYEDFQMGTFKLVGPIPSGATVIYRGWMMGASEYEALVASITAKGGIPLTSVKKYLACHHLPNWYPLISEFTAETKVFPVGANLEAELNALGWGKYFLKDYVKSLKTSGGSSVSDPSQVKSVLAEMEKFRGTIEGGICVRRFEEFEDDTERRYFVVRGVPHSPSGDVPAIVKDCAGRIPSDFFSVDVVMRKDGVQRIIEVGDGQVSDIVGWDAGVFAKMWVGEG